MAETPPPLPTRVVASDSNAPVKAQRIDPTLPGIKRYQSLGVREVPAKQRGPGEFEQFEHGPQPHHAEQAR